MSTGAFLQGLAGGYFSGEKIKDIKADRENPDEGRGVIMDNWDRSQSSTPAASNPTPSVNNGPIAPVKYTGNISDRASHAYNRFTEAGLPSHVAAGLVGNLMQESGPTINPEAVGDNGNAFGSAQHNGPRRRALEAFAAKRGVGAGDFDTQLDFILHEGNTTEKRAWNAILATKTADEAARVASDKFWRPGVPHVEQRMGYASSIYDKFSQPAPRPEGEQRGILGVVDAGKELIRNFYKKGE
jgi:hypothetical protein